MRQETAGIDIDRVSARGADDGDTHLQQPLSEIACRVNSVAQVILIEHLAQSDRDGVEVPASQTAIGGKALGQDQQFPSLLGQPVVAGGQKSADIGQAVLLCAEGRTVGQREHLLGDRLGALFRESILALFDEVGILGKPAGIKIEGNPELPAQFTRGPDVRHRGRLSPARIIGHREDDTGDLLRLALQQSFQGGQIDVALEGVLFRWMERLGYLDVGRLCTQKFGIGACGVEERIADHLASLHIEARKENPFGGTALMGRDDMFVTGQILDPLFEPEPGSSSGV